MPTSINLAQLEGLLARGAQLVEVLPSAEYAEEHLPSAVNLPLSSSTPPPPPGSTPAGRWSCTAGTPYET